ncbi:hypothetical protein, partial [Streptomyces sp. H39-C1]
MTTATTPPPRSGRAASEVAVPDVTSQVSSPAVGQPLLGEQRKPAKEVQRLDRVIIRFAGDSGDGM